MKRIIAIAVIIVIAVIVACEFIRVTRIIIAYFKGDKDTIDRLTHTYDECESIAFKEYGCSKELFAEYWKEVRNYKKNALPWDALDLCAWEYDVLNNK